MAIAATISLGLLFLGGCQSSQTGSSTHLGAQSAKNLKKGRAKKTRRISRKSSSPQLKADRDDAGIIVKAASNISKVKKSKKSRRKLSLRKSKKTLRKKTKGKRRVARRGRSYDKLIRRHARANGVPYALARAVVQVESGFKASARGGVGEIGLMQLRKATARGMGYRGSTRGLYNPETNIKYGMRYLGRAYKLGGRSTCGAILKYNAGHGARRMNPISRRYCGKVRRIMRGRV